MKRITQLFASTFLLITIAASAQDLCLEVLGSGGPTDVDGRASSSYLVWLDGKARIMIDAGGGAALRFGESDAKLEDLDMLGITHMHVDHSVDIITLAKRGYFAKREEPLLLIGPSGSDKYPSMEEFVDIIFNGETGAYRYLAHCGNCLKLTAKSVDVSNAKPTVVYENDDFIVSALSVEHADLPALAFRIDSEAGSIAFSGDQSARVPELVDFLKDVDLLVMHFPYGETGPASEAWHAKPSTIGKLAAEADVKALVLSHFMAWSLKELDKNVEVVKEYYDGPIVLAQDLERVKVD
jgi:ribonuclease BN (tRNA processing enzyme)